MHQLCSLLLPPRVSFSPVNGHLEIIREADIVVVVVNTIELELGVVVERRLNCDVAPLHILLDGDPLGLGLGLVQGLVLVLVVLKLILLNVNLALFHTRVSRNPCMVKKAIYYYYLHFINSDTPLILIQLFTWNCNIKRKSKMHGMLMDFPGHSFESW